LVSEMAQATEQQSTGIEQVNSAVGQMDQVTQQNAAMVEQSTAASRSLAQDATTLSDLMAFFSVGDAASSNESKAKPARLQATGNGAAKPRRTPVTKIVTGSHRSAAATALAPNPVPAEEWSEF